MLLQQVAHGQQKQAHRGQALLAVDDIVLDLAAVALHRTDDAAEKMAGPVLAGDLLQVFIELAAVFLLPVVFPLIDRDYKVFFAARPSAPINWLLNLSWKSPFPVA